MNYTDLRRLLLKVFIGFLSLTALMAIVSVLSHQFGRTQLKVLLTTFSISAGSICAMACAAYLERRGSRGVGRGVGSLGIVVASFAVVLALAGVWSEITQSGFWKVTVTFIVVAVAWAHVCLLRLPTLSPSHRWAQTAATILIGFLAVQIVLAVWGEIHDELYYRFVAVVSVLVVLLTLVIPICTRLAAQPAGGLEGPAPVAEACPPLADRLVLRRVSGAVFADEAGRTYRVTALEAGVGTPPSGNPAAPADDAGPASEPPRVS